MILAITNPVSPRLSRPPRGRANGRDGADGGGLVVAGLISAPSCPYDGSW